MWPRFKQWILIQGESLKEALFEICKLYSIGFIIGIGFWLSLFCLCVLFSPAHAAEVQIPRAAQQYRATLTREARVVWGLNAPISVFAAQIHTESWWRNDTVSTVGAQGLAQFMPSTAKWLPTVAPETGRPAPFNPAWSLRACVVYDKILHDQLRAMSSNKSVTNAKESALSAYDRMAFTLSAYNGGMGWVNRDRRLAARSGVDPDKWFGAVDGVNAGRKTSSIRENRAYVRLIVQVRQQAYIKAGWGPGVTEGRQP